MADDFICEGVVLSSEDFDRYLEVLWMIPAPVRALGHDVPWPEREELPPGDIPPGRWRAPHADQYDTINRLVLMLADNDRFANDR